MEIQRSNLSVDPLSRRFHIYALLWVTRNCEEAISQILVTKCGVPRQYIQRGLHLTLYHARRPLPGLTFGTMPMKLFADITETRFMVLAPGGENPRPELEPSRRSVGIRLTRRNTSIPEVLRLRRSVYQFETPEVVGRRLPSSDWRNCFGARHFQPHIKLLRPGSGVDRDLKKLGVVFRSALERIEFGKLEVKMAILDDGETRF